MNSGNRKASIIQSFSSKKFKYGSYATVMTIIVIAAVIIVNLVADLIPVRIDLTWNKLYSLSEQTFKVLDGLEDDVTIYFVGEPDSVNLVIKEIVQRYASRSNRISIDYIDPVRDPITAQKYTKDGRSLSTGSIVVESGEKFRVISQYDMYNFSSNTSQLQVESLAVEQRLTSAILFVSGAEMPVAYLLEGHGEAILDYNTRKQMELDNFNIQNLNLLGKDAVPDDADLLIINAPTRDLSEDEAKVLKAYLENEGKAIFLMNLLIEDLPNFQSVFQTYGIRMTNSLVIEGEQGRYIGGNPLFLLPQYGSHEIVSPIKTNDLPLYIPGGQAIEILDTKRNTTTIETLLSTSDKAFARAANSESTSLEKQEEDLAGPFSLAVAIEDRVYNLAANETYTTRLVVIGNAEFLNTGFEGGVDLFLNSLNWVFEREESISIRPKSLGVQPLKVTNTQLRIYTILSMIVIPVGCLIAGLVVWLRRRHL
ncbi:MAG TPA: GldG family protein [Clostridiales bacterium]|nr:GldG family protein [Clostridiales bacterium]